MAIIVNEAHPSARQMAQMLSIKIKNKLNRLKVI